MPRTVAGVLEHRGCRLAYEIAGEGPPVLWIQGVGAHGSCWRPQIEGLAERFACLSYDNRGIGKSQPKGMTITVPQLAEDASRLIEAAGWESAHVVGHSMGGMVALQLALDFRQRVRSLFLSCTFARGQQVAPPTPRMIWLGARSRIGTRSARRRAFLGLVLPDSALAREDAATLARRLEPLFGHDLADSPPIVSAQLRAMRAANVRPRLGELAGLRCLVVSAVHDPIAPPRLGRALASGIPGARFVCVEDASHGLPIHRADTTNRLLEEHFRGASPSAGPGA